MQPLRIHGIAGEEERGRDHRVGAVFVHDGFDPGVIRNTGTMANVKALNVDQSWKIPDGPTSLRKRSAMHLMERRFKLVLVLVFILRSNLEG